MPTTSSRPIEDRFASVARHPPTVVATAPGRINLIGEHTDYNDGFVFPAAINRTVRVAARRNDSGTLSAHAAMYGATAVARLDQLAPVEEPRWMNYVSGIAFHLLGKGVLVPGAELFIEGDVPLGAGLSSSAALEVAVAHALLALVNAELPPTEVALLCQQAEHTFAGVHCGIMDQFIAELGKQGHALFIDCRSLSFDRIPIPADLRLVVCDTGVRRELATSAYNDRREACMQGVHTIRHRYPEVRALRDVTSVMVDEFQSRLDPIVFRRCRHVVTENERVLQSVRALTDGRVEEFGKLMYQSHMSLRDDYEVSCPELDTVVDCCAGEEGVLGARMTGAGFGGCAICLVRQEHADNLGERLRIEYPAVTGRTPSVFISSIENGATVRRV